MILLHTARETLIIEKIESSAGFVKIRLEDIPIIKNYDVILHIIEPRSIETILNTLESNVNQVNALDNKQLLQYELESLRAKVRTILPHRHRRAFGNLLRTGLKWLFCSMDDKDRTEIKEHLSIVDENKHMIINNLNKNIQINNHFNETFTKLKDIIEAHRIKICTRKI